MEPYWLGREEGDSIWMYDALDTIKADAHQTGGALTAVEFRDFEGSTVPLHVSDRWDRGFYVLDGTYTFLIDDEAITAEPGTWLFAPRNTPHAWRCETSLGRLLSITTPAGLEAFYRQVGEPVGDRTRLPPRTEPDLDVVARAAEQHGITIVGPPPGA